jgi:ribosomal protein S18 acetylase RimI-like enzyme
LIEDGKAWVLVEGREVLGMLTMRTEEDHLSVQIVAVWPDRQGEGLGRRLMAFVDEETRNRNLSEIRLYTNKKMWENLVFYERLRFEERSAGSKRDTGASS